MQKKVFTQYPENSSIIIRYDLVEEWLHFDAQQNSRFKYTVVILTWFNFVFNYDALLL